MSNGPFHAMALLIKARLEAWPALEDVPVVIDLQKDITSEIGTAQAKATGCAITIFYEGDRDLTENLNPPRVTARYSVKCYGLPVVEDVNADWIPAETAKAEVMKALHHWVPTDDNHNATECKVQPGDLVPDRDFLIYEVPVEVPVQL